jgi:hypothetical protein
MGVQVSIAAWIYDASIVIRTARQPAALDALRTSFEDCDSWYGEHARAVDDFPAFLEAINFTCKRQEGALLIDGGDIDVISNGLIRLFETLGPYVEAGGVVEIRDEEGEQMNFCYNGEQMDIEFSISE